MDPPTLDIEEIVRNSGLSQDERKKIALDLNNISIYGKEFQQKTKHERLKITSSNPAREVKLTISIKANVGNTPGRIKDVEFRELDVAKVEEQANHINSDEFDFLSKHVRYELQRYLFAYCQTASDYAIYVGKAIKAKQAQESEHSRSQGPARELDLKSGNKGLDTKQFSKDGITYKLTFEYGLAGNLVSAIFGAEISTDTQSTNEEQINAHNRRVKKAKLAVDQGECTFLMGENFIWLKGGTESVVDDYIKQMNIADLIGIREGTIKREDRRFGDKLLVSPAELAESAAKLIKKGKVTHRTVEARKD